MAKKTAITTFFVAVTAIILNISVAVPIQERNRRQLELPCSHPLRISAPQYFTHCNNPNHSPTLAPPTPAPCTYTQWGAWETVSGTVRAVSISQCPSGEAFTEQRNRSVSLPVNNNQHCTNTTETRQACMPDAADRLILALNLGGSHQDYSSLHPQTVPDSRPQSRPGPRPFQPQSNTGGGGVRLASNNIPLSVNLPPPISASAPFSTNNQPHQVPGPAQPTTSPGLPQAQFWRVRRQNDIHGPGRRCPHLGGNGQICHHIAGKRSTLYAEEFTDNNLEPTAPVNNIMNDELPLEELEEVVPFNYEEHAHRFRRQIAPENCSADDTQHVLFVLDSSGSIGASSYTRMKAAVAKLTPLFCRKVKFALMTFSSQLNLEFCFDCFENTFNGRNASAVAINASSYQARMTHTGEAVRCICDDLLSPSCGISSNPSCLDVVFITDGRSNGRRDVCREIECLHNRIGINTYAIGINGFNQAELNCIADGSDRLSAFEFRSFDDFEQAINDVIIRLLGQISTAPFSCAALNTQPGIPIHGNAGLTS